MKRTLKSFWAWCRTTATYPSPSNTKLSQKLRGFYQYAGMRGNYRALETVLEGVRRTGAIG